MGYQVRVGVSEILALLCDCLRRFGDLRKTGNWKFGAYTWGVLSKYAVMMNAVRYCFAAGRVSQQGLLDFENICFAVLGSPRRVRLCGWQRRFAHLGESTSIEYFRMYLVDFSKSDEESTDNPTNHAHTNTKSEGEGGVISEKRVVEIFRMDRPEN
jgi:hypothetical protein